MNRRVWLGSFVALTVSAGLVACGADEESEVAAQVTPDGSAPSTPTPGSDSGAPVVVPDGGSDSATDAQAAFAPIVPQSTTRIANAINPYGLLFASDGFVYASGATIDETADRKLAVWRFKDGVLDATFGTSGVVTVGIEGNESSFDIVEVSPGELVVHAVTGTVGASPGKVYLVKLSKDAGGVFSFGTPVVVPFSWTDGDFTGWPGANPPAYATSWGIALDKSTAGSPKIVVFASGAPAKALAGAQRTNNDRWIARVLASTLAPDPAFNGGSAFSTDADGQDLSDNARRGLVHADGTIVSAGYTNFGGSNHVVLIRLKPDGTVDTTFGFGTTAPGTPGQTKFNPFLAAGGFAEAYGIVRQASGRYVTTGYGTSHFDAPSIGLDLVSFGVKADGLDVAYGRLGSFAWQSEKDKGAGLGASPHTERGRDLTSLPDGRLVHVGVYDDYASVYVLDANGKPDPGTGVNGLIEYSYPGAFFKVAVSPDGKQIAATAQSLNQTTDAGAPLGSVLATLKVGP
jgi:uncharacterized delta-60 repeat protein